MRSRASLEPTWTASRWAPSSSTAPPNAPWVSVSPGRLPQIGPDPTRIATRGTTRSMTDQSGLQSLPPEPLRIAELPWSQDWVERFLRCRRCEASTLDRVDRGIVCRACGHEWEIVGPGLLEDIPAAAPGATRAASRSGLDAVAMRVREFYEQNPFPNYDGYESVGDLLSRAARGVYAAMLDRQIPIGARVLEIGCGTGQLGAFLSIGGRCVVGVDMTRASLELAGGFKQRHGLRNCNFLHGDLFDLPLRREAFDLVIAKGVLMATRDARAAFHAICPLVRPGGYVIVGLYNRYGRIPTTLRRLYFKLTKADPRRVDYVMKKMAQSDQKLRAWYLDQYAHPQETRHSVDQVLRWFDEEGFDPTGAAPPIRLGQPFDPSVSL